MKKRKGIIIIFLVVAACILLLFIFDKMEKKIKKEVFLSDSEVKKYTLLAHDLSKVNIGNISKILIQGEKQKISFVFSGSSRVTVNYSDDEYKISSNDATYEQIDSSVIVLNKLIGLNYNDFYRIEFDNAEKCISIQADYGSRGIFIIKFSDDKIISKTLEMTKNTADIISIWKYGMPFLLLVVVSFIFVFLAPIKEDKIKKK